jgi:cellulose synthase/poly-beta-1,6-N-acetylglucosamine synthase-like glycosyltransferase
LTQENHNFPKSAAIDVSIIIPAYNAEAFLQQAIESATSQSGVEVEVIVVDDGSTDRTREIALNNSSVQLIEQEHQGPSSARNRGLWASRGQFIKFLDSDDLLDPMILARQVPFLSQADCKTVAYSDLRRFSDATGEKSDEIFEFGGSENLIPQLLRRNFQVSSCLYFRSDLINAGGFDCNFTYAEEYKLHLELALKGFKFIHVSGIGAHIREHDTLGRITNLQKTRKFDESSQLRMRTYLELFRDHYGTDIPKEIRRHFATGAFESALAELRRGRFTDARRALARVHQFDHTFGDLIFGLTKSVTAIAQGKWSKLRQKLGLLKQ